MAIHRGANEKKKPKYSARRDGPSPRIQRRQRERETSEMRRARWTYFKYLPERWLDYEGPLERRAGT